MGKPGQPQLSLDHSHGAKLTWRKSLQNNTVWWLIILLFKGPTTLLCCYVRCLMLALLRLGLHRDFGLETFVMTRDRSVMLSALQLTKGNLVTFPGPDSRQKSRRFEFLATVGLRQLATTFTFITAMQAVRHCNLYP